MNKNYDIIYAPIITEKSALLANENKYAFKVDPKANKTQIKEYKTTSSSPYTDRQLDHAKALKCTKSYKYLEDSVSEFIFLSTK